MISDPGGKKYSKNYKNQISKNIFDENVKSEPPSRRELKNQGLEGIEKASKIDVKATSQACWQNVQKIDPKVFPGATQEGTKMRSNFPPQKKRNKTPLEA